MRLKHLKQRYWEAKGPTLMAPASIHYSNVNLVDPQTNLPTKVWRRFLDDGTKVRVSKASGAIIPKPEYSRDRPRNLLVGPKDTAPDDVLEVTYETTKDFDSLPTRPSGRLPGAGRRMEGLEMSDNEMEFLK